MQYKGEGDLLKRLNGIKYFGVLFYYWAQYHLTSADKDHCKVIEITA
jgi:hypothetical protein